MVRTGSKRQVYFGEFQLDLDSSELRNNGSRSSLIGQPLQILTALLERPGELVTREELKKKLWPEDTFVDFDQSLNKAVNRLREALNDSADHPRFIETLSRRGYRFIGSLEIVPEIVSNVSREFGHSTSEFPATGQTKARTGSRIRWIKISASILVGVACATVLIFSSYRIFRRVNLAPEVPVPFTDYPGFEGCPAFSPDGSQIAFAWSGDPAKGAKGDDLYVKAIHSENLLRLTQHPSAYICAAWSPDGTQIAFVRLSAARFAGVAGADSIDDTGIYLVPALGGPERKLRSTQGGWGGVTWSADGKWLAYSDHTRPAGVIHPTDPTRIYALSLETLESRQIPHAEECLSEQQPAFSHSGDRLAYVCLLKIKDNESHIYSVSLSGGSPKMVAKFTTVGGFLRGIAWTADDKRLIVSRPHDFGFELNEVTLADGTLRKLAVGQGEVSAPAISGKGDRLAYSVFTSHVNIWRKDLWHSEVAAEKLIFSTYEQIAPMYSPDGKHIAFTSNRGGEFEIWMSDADGTNLVRMSDSQSYKAGVARWSPDSQKLAFDSGRSGRSEIYIVDVSERLPRKLITNLSEMSKPSWSHDGKWLYFEATSEQRIFRCPAGGGDAVALSADTGSFPLESYDGETVFFVSPAYGEYLRMVSLKQPGTSFAVKGMPAVNGPSFYTVVPGGIYFAPLNASKSIQHFDFTSRQVRKIFDLDKEYANSPSVSPDGRWVLYAQPTEENSDIMLVDHFK